MAQELNLLDCDDMLDNSDACRLQGTVPAWALENYQGEPVYQWSFWSAAARRITPSSDTPTLAWGIFSSTGDEKLLVLRVLCLTN